MNNDESLNPRTYLYIPELSITSAASGGRYIYMLIYLHFWGIND